MKTRILVLALASTSFVACGDDDPKAGDTAPATTSPTDATTSTPDTSTLDTSTEDDTAVATTADPDTSTEPDTSVPTKCACEGGSTCLLANNETSCASLGGICGPSGQQLVEACDDDDVVTTCVRENTTTFRYYARIEGWIADAADDCASTLVAAAGTFSITPVPVPAGDVCSCQRTVSACTQGVGDVCDILNCDTPEGLQDSACTDTGRVPGRCVTRDGSRELAFYGVSAETAEQTCLGASAAEYYWYPAGL